MYSKLRSVGHVRKEALARSIRYKVENLLPFPSFEPIELQIEGALDKLENLVRPRYRPQGTELSADTMRNEIDSLVGYLDSQLNLNERKRFSELQIKRYDSILERLAEIYPPNSRRLKK
ncbi:hypothetical protein J4421_03065 [Candidatus Woesearchaeota archaeon]|nr:hypothetical protein [Candidatus Woesearchaeota archaeon]